MLLLTSQSDLLRLITSTGADIDVHAAWMDLLAGVVTYGRTNAQPTTATTTTIVGSPGGSTQRSVKTIIARNIDPSLTNDLTFIHSDGSIIVTLFKATLWPGESVTFTENGGWQVFNANGQLKLAPAIPPTLIRRQTADSLALADVATVQPWFTVNGNILIPETGTWLFKGVFHSTRVAGTTSHGTDFLFAATAPLVINHIDAWGQCGEGDVVTINDSDIAVCHAVTGLLSFKATGDISATENIKAQVWGSMYVTTAMGFFTPQFKYSAAPGGIPTVARGTYFMLQKIGDGDIAQIGAWA